jgi:cytochrome c-type biogenesis protein
MEWAFQNLQQLSEFNFYAAVAISFFAGVVTSVNPCMLGMASSVLSFQHHLSRRGQLVIGLIFMGSFALTLTLLGWVSSYFGDRVFQWNQMYGSSLYMVLGIVFIGIGCYIWGLRMRHLMRHIPIRIVAFYTKQSTNKNTQVHPGFKAASLGSLFGLTPSPCTTPMILAMLAYTMMKGSVVMGSILLFSYGIGHGVPFILMSWISGTINRSRWMMRWQRLFYKVIGLLIFFVGIYFLFYEVTPMSM